MPNNWVEVPQLVTSRATAQLLSCRPLREVPSGAPLSTTQECHVGDQMDGGEELLPKSEGSALVSGPDMPLPFRYPGNGEKHTPTAAACG